jgi:hypothetical protein
MTEDDKQFCVNIKEFINIIGDFLLHIKEPAKYTTNSIEDKSTRTFSNDKYVKHISSLTLLLEKIVLYIKTIIITMNTFFTYKNIHSMNRMVSELKAFLQFIVLDNIIYKLEEYRYNFKKVNLGSQLCNNVEKISSVIFTLVNISVDITSLFLPQFTEVKKILVNIEECKDKKLKTLSQKKDLNINEDTMINILKDIFKLDLNGEKIVDTTRVDSQFIINCVHDKHAEILILELSKLEEEYYELSSILIKLKVGINKYKERKKSILYKIRTLFKTDLIF